MNRTTAIYCSLIIGAALLMLPFQDWAAIASLGSEHFFGFGTLVTLAVASELLWVMAVVGRHQISSSIAFIPFFACVLLFPPPASLIATIITSAITQFFVHKKPLLRAGFNTAQAALSIAIASAFYEVLGGTHAIPLALDLKSVQDLTAFGGLSVAFFVVNQVLVSVAIALFRGERVGTVFNRVLAPSGANFFYDVLVSPIAVIVALLYSYIEVPGLIIGILPLLVIRHSYSSNAKLEQANRDLLTVLIKTIETRDPYTSGHSIRVSLLARAIAEDMDMRPAQIDRIEMTGLVHDIGKVDVSFASIISKEGSLSESERKVICTHAAKGAEFLETLTSFPDDVIKGVRHHHERYDGTGYPNGLGGNDIPLPSRIIMLCDSIDAMLSDRPYRRALSMEHVRSELARCAGTQFDPKIVDLILRRNTLERAAALVRPEEKKPHLIKVSA